MNKLRKGGVVTRPFILDSIDCIFPWTNKLSTTTKEALLRTSSPKNSRSVTVTLEIPLKNMALSSEDIASQIKSQLQDALLKKTSV